MFIIILICKYFCSKLDHDYNIVSFLLLMTKKIIYFLQAQVIEFLASLFFVLFFFLIRYSKFGIMGLQKVIYLFILYTTIIQLFDDIFV